MEELILPIDRHILAQEINQDNFIRPTNNGKNEIYIFNENDCPNAMAEVGRLRELTFREAGGGTGKSVDIDEFDSCPNPYLQLIVWNPKDKEIVGGYRFIKVIDSMTQDGQFHLSTSEIFQYTDKLKTEFFPKTIELGRSFVQPQYQPSSENRKGLFSLDNLWDGLAAILILNPEIEYFFGKVTMYPTFNSLARDYILSFMEYYFPDPDNLLVIPNKLEIQNDTSALLEQIKGLPYKDGHHILNKMVRDLGENIPPLFNSYMNLSPTMRKFGTAVNHHFGDVEETGILVNVKDIYQTKKQRHFDSFISYQNASIQS
jgi:hypothetical protein